MTKKAAALLLAASLAVSVCATPVFAADASIEKGNTDSDKKSASEVVYNVTGGYKWSIPATINFGSNAKIKDTKEGNERVVNANQDANIASEEATDSIQGKAPAIHVSSNVIKYGQTLKISISDASANSYFETGTGKGFFITSGTDATKGQKLYYTIEKPATATGETATPVTALGDSILEVKAGTPTGKQELTFTLNTANGGTAEMEGNYKGTLSFTAALIGEANGSNTGA